jgi:hypothetical protein
VDICFGTRPSHAAKSRPFAKAVPLPIPTTMSLGRSDLLLVLLSPGSFSERLRARARPVHPIPRPISLARSALGTSRPAIQSLGIGGHCATQSKGATLQATPCRSAGLGFYSSRPVSNGKIWQYTLARAQVTAGGSSGFPRLITARPCVR